MRQGYIDPVVSKEKTISTGPPGGTGASNLAFLEAVGSGSFLGEGFGLASSSFSVVLDGAERFVPFPADAAPLPLAVGVALVAPLPLAAGVLFAAALPLAAGVLFTVALPLDAGVLFAAPLPLAPLPLVAGVLFAAPLPLAAGEALVEVVSTVFE